MFNIGGGEMVVIFLLALLVLGPERLPKAMGQVGRAVAQMRKLSSGFQDEIRRAMDPMDAPFRPGEQTLTGPVPSVTDEVKVVSTDPAQPDGPTDPDPVSPSDLLAKPPVADHPDDPTAPTAVEPETDALVVEPDPRSTVTPLRPRLDEADGDGGDRATG